MLNDTTWVINGKYSVGRAVDSLYALLSVEEKREVFEFLCRLPKPTGMPRLQAADLANPLVFGKMDWKPEISMVLWINHQPSWSSNARELKVKPRHRHHIWPTSYKENHA